MEISSASPGRQRTAPYPRTYPEGNDTPRQQRTERESRDRANGERPLQNGKQLEKALGWFSIGLGVSQLLAPRSLSRASGVADHPVVMRMLGVREIASGVAILSDSKPGNWIWTRVAGDAMDLALLGMAARSPGTRRNRAAAMGVMVAGITALDILSTVKSSSSDTHQLHAEKSIVINRTPEECYRYWRNLENFPRFMKHLQAVQEISETRSHWTAKGPAGITVEWDAELTIDQPDHFMAWQSVEGADVDNVGEVRFERAPGERGTIVRIAIEYKPPGGKAGALIAKLFGKDPAQQIDDDLRRFKWLIETGEIPTTVGQSSGPRDVFSRLIFRKGAPG